MVRLASLPPDPYIIAAYIPSVNKKVKVFSPVFIGIVAIVLWRSCIDGNSFFDLFFSPPYLCKVLRSKKHEITNNIG